MMKLLIPPPIQGFAIGLSMWFLDRQFDSVSYSVSGQKLSAGILLIVGFIIELIAIAAFVKAKTTVNPLTPTKTKTLVIRGIYRISRNPMYLGLAILLLGWFFWLGNPVNILLYAGFIIYITVFQIKPEEEILRQKFGSDYDDYCANVRRWI